MAAPSRTVELTVNGSPVELQIEDRALLIDVLRSDLGLTGTKRSCDAQVCGSCTVLVDDEPISSCAYLAADAAGRVIRTIEGVSVDGDLHPVQRSFLEAGALQCGFCTPGMIMASVCLLERSPTPNAEEVVEWLDGNICRCTGYQSIVEAVVAVNGRR